MRFDDLKILDLNKYEDEDSTDVYVDAFERDYVKEQHVPANTEIKHDEADMEAEEAVDWKKELVSWVLTIGITMLVMFGVKEYIIINANVPTGSMENTIMTGDNVFGYRLAYAKEAPERGDVIFFYFPDDESQKYVKRIIGLPGETVTIQDAKVYIDGELLEEPYLKEEWVIKTGPYEFKVPEDSYFCMGDNRNRSADAREWNNPYVAREKIIGKALWVYFPFSHWGGVE